MAVDVSGFIVKPNEWEGLFKAGDTLERRKLKDQQLSEQREAKKTATANFLKNYLDPKDYLSGTAADPMLIQSLNDLMQQGAQLAAQGVDAPTLMMALSPGVAKVSNYSTKAKAINQGIDDQLKRLKDSGEEGFDTAKLKDEALSRAFYDTDAKGVRKLNLDKADPSVNWVDKTIQEVPDLVTNAGGIDDFVKKTPMTKTLSDITTYDDKMRMDRQKVHLIGQNYMVPETDKKGNPTGMVPKYETVTDKGKPVMGSFKNAKGEEEQAPMRALDEDTFDRMMNSSRSTAAYVQGLTKTYLKEHEKQTGEKITMADPKAKLYARVVMYDELKNRSGSTIESAGINDKPSGAEVYLNVMNTPEGMAFKRNSAAASKEGKNSVMSPEEAEKAKKTNAIQAFAKVFGGDRDFLPEKTEKVNGKDVINITEVLPGGGLKKGRGENEAFKNIYFDPKNRNLIVTTEEKDDYNRTIKKDETIPEADMGAFMRRIAEANGIPTAAVKDWLKKVGYENGKFKQEEQPAEETKSGPTLMDRVKEMFGFGKKAPNEGKFN